MTATAAQIAKPAGIAPRTKQFVLRDEYGFAYDGGPTEHALTGIQRACLDAGLGQRTSIAAMSLHKCFSTGRMNAELSRRVREATPYRLCKLAAWIAANSSASATVGELADFWINEHRAEIEALFA